MSWLGETYGPLEVVEDLSRHAGPVAGIRTATGEEWVVKQVPTLRAYRRELHAYTHWTPALGSQAPRLIGADAASATIVLERLPGTAAWSFRPADHRAAGALLSRLHGAEPARSGGPTLAQAATRMLRRSLQRLPGQAAADDVRLLRTAITELRSFDSLARVPCHGDFGGHNWMRGEELRVIDFSGAGWNAAAYDFARLQIGPWWERPDLIAAFLGGYGRELHPTEVAAVHWQLPVFAFNTWTHGLRRGDTEMTRRGRRRLDRWAQGAYTTRAGRIRRTARAMRGRALRAGAGQRGGSSTT